MLAAGTTVDRYSIHTLSNSHCSSPVQAAGKGTELLGADREVLHQVDGILPVVSGISAGNRSDGGSTATEVEDVCSVVTELEGECGSALLQAGTSCHLFVFHAVPDRMENE